MEKPDISEVSETSKIQRHRPQPNSKAFRESHKPDKRDIQQYDRDELNANKYSKSRNGNNNYSGNHRNAPKVPAHSSTTAEINESEYWGRKAGAAICQESIRSESHDNGGFSGCNNNPTRHIDREKRAKSHYSDSNRSNHRKHPNNHESRQSISEPAIEKEATSSISAHHESERTKTKNVVKVVDTSSSVFRDVLDDNRLTKRTLVLNNIPEDMSSERREQLGNAYLSLLHGGGGSALRWVSNTLCFIVFSTEALCQRGIDRSARKPDLAEFPPKILSTIPDLCSAENMLVVRELYDNIPAAQRDASVANRMITAALGIRMPRKPVPSTKKDTDVSPVNSTCEKEAKLPDTETYSGTPTTIFQTPSAKDPAVTNTLDCG